MTDTADVRGVDQEGSTARTTDAGESPAWAPTTLTITTKHGPMPCPALVHPWCPGLAVTMADFGVFRTTHVATGLAVGGYYERLGNALAEAAHLAAIFLLCGVDPTTATQEDMSAALKANYDTPVPFPGSTSTSGGVTRPTTILQWFQVARTNYRGDEFPWEGWEDSPNFFAEQAMGALGKMLTERVSVPVVDPSRSSPDEVQS